LFLSLALACALAFGSLAAQQGTPAPSSKATSTEKTAKKPKESKGTKVTKEEIKPTTKQEIKPPKQEIKPPKQEIKPPKQEIKPTKEETKATKRETEPTKESKGAQEKPEPAREESGQEIDIPVPDGVPVKGIKVPSYSPEGKLLMMLDAEQARKLDAERIEFENLKIDAYSEDDKKIYVELPRSIFNLTTRILTSESRVLIRREDFELVGDAGEFYTKNRFAKILGNVKMTILSTENLNTP
jgi:flagellar biosynthesis GTPase FlhF